MSWWPGGDCEYGPTTGMHGTVGVHDVLAAPDGTAWIYQSRTTFETNRTLASLNPDTGKMRAYRLNTPNGRIMFFEQAKWQLPHDHDDLPWPAGYHEAGSGRDSRMNATAPIDYLNPNLPAGLRSVVMPVVDATPTALTDYGYLVDDPEDYRIEIVRWPAQGSRPVDADTGNQGGTTEGVFISEWRGDILYGRNDAVDGQYILAYGQAPELARTDHADAPRRMLLWHANYHPDGGQLFFPQQRQPFYVPLALPGDDVTPDRFVCFRFDGRQGLYIHPNIWHEGVFALRGTQRFFDRQGAVHARVSVDFAREFGCLVEAPIPEFLSTW
jgi:hypothetical protein